MNKIIAVDPGPEMSSYVMWDGKTIIEATTIPNERIISYLRGQSRYWQIRIFVIEQVTSYGMSVGHDIFETVFWSGRFCQVWDADFTRIPRMDVKMHLCHNSRAKDSNIRQALIDRFGDRSTKKRLNPVYGDIKLKGGEWQAFALAVTYWDQKAPQFIAGG